MKNITMEDVRNVEAKLLPCPFCGIKPKIIICDDEGNIKRNPEEYIADPWSGLSFALIHPMDKGQHCPVETDKDDCIVLGNCLYGSLDEIIEMWNRRFISEETKNLVQRYFYNTPETKSWFDDVSEIYMRLNEEDTYIPVTSALVCGRLSYLKRLSFDEAVEKMRKEEWKDGFDIRFVFKNGNVNDYKI